MRRAGHLGGSILVPATFSRRVVRVVLIPCPTCAYGVTRWIGRAFEGEGFERDARGRRRGCVVADAWMPSRFSGALMGTRARE